MSLKVKEKVKTLNRLTTYIICYFFLYDMSNDLHFIESENSLVNICCKQVSLWDTSRVAVLLMKTSVICHDCNIQV